LKALFAPWRLEVIESYKSTRSCILCGLFEATNDQQALILTRTDQAYVVLNKFPYSNGHLMIVPNRHTGHWEDLSREELSDFTQLSQKLIRCLKKALSCQDFNLGANLGEAAGAGIPGHVHWHVVPRWPGDHNFMPVMAETKVISEHLEKTYQKLQAVWEEVA